MIPHNMTSQVESLLHEETQVSIITLVVLLAFNKTAKVESYIVAVTYITRSAGEIF
jgi:hypothetical protein